MMRLDRLLVERQLATSRNQAQRWIEAGCVQWREGGAWRTATKPSLKMPEDQPLQVLRSEEDRFVSRGGRKLAGALERTGLDPAGWVALDVGQSTGGFSDCLLQADVQKVVGVDVGHDQLNEAVARHPAVVCYEGINARALPRDELLAHATGGFDLVVMDVSFISQTLILPGLPPLLKPGGQLLSLVKPQFEVGRENIGKGGLVRDVLLYRQVEDKIRKACEDGGLTLRDYFPSAITGGDGNHEFFVWAGKDKKA